MQLSNDKLIDRGTKMIMDETQIDYSAAEVLLKRFGSVRKAIEAYKNGN
jgi:N-acetylmuramic acid 6-phosphate etherase